MTMRGICEILAIWLQKLLHSIEHTEIRRLRHFLLVPCIKWLLRIFSGETQFLIIIILIILHTNQRSARPLRSTDIDVQNTNFWLLRLLDESTPVFLFLKLDIRTLLRFRKRCRFECGCQTLALRNGHRLIKEQSFVKLLRLKVKQGER